MAHADRQCLPGLRFGQATLQLLSSVVSWFLHALGHRAAGAMELSSNPTSIARATRIWAHLHGRSQRRTGHRKMSPQCAVVPDCIKSCISQAASGNPPP